MPPKARPKAAKRKRGANDALSEAIVDTLTCPITSALCVRPVCAADGHLYEKDAIEKWLANKSKSPLTNEAMGSHLVDSITARKQCLAAIEGKMPCGIKCFMAIPRRASRSVEQLIVTPQVAPSTRRRPRRGTSRVPRP